MSKKIKFITAIYNNLYGTDFGGRIGRVGHYKYSLLSLLKMSNAEFVCYVSKEELPEHLDFFYTQNKIPEKNLKIISFDLTKIKLNTLINKYKNIEETRKSQRCKEIQYLKFLWWYNEDKTYDYYYWIDAGLSYSGLLPNKHRVHHDILPENQKNRVYFESNLFNNIFLKNLTDYSETKFFLVEKENKINHWANPVNEKWYKNYELTPYIIGGLFGGNSSMWDKIVSIFEKYLIDIIESDNYLPSEEQIMTLMYHNHKELFKTKYFETWLHEDNVKSHSGLEENYLDTRKSFYKILEELNE